MQHAIVHESKQTNLQGRILLEQHVNTQIVKTFPAVTLKEFHGSLP